MLEAQLRADDGWCAATIANISRRGVMIRCPSPPERPSVVEIRLRGLTIVGRVVWSLGSRCGVRTQDPIDVEALIADSGKPAKRTSAEWRTVTPADAKGRAPVLAAQADASRRSAGLLNWTLVAAGGAVGAALMANLAGSFFEAPLSQVSDALARPE